MTQPQAIQSRPILLSILLSCVLFGSILSAQQKQAPSLKTNTYRVPDRFLSHINSLIPFDQQNEKLGVRKVLETVGLAFPRGSNVKFNQKENTLVVKHTGDGLQFIENLLETIRRDTEQQIHIYQEWIEVDHQLFSDWLYENRLDDDGTKLRNQAQKWIRQGKATIIESALVSGRSGQRAKTESVDEYIYPTEYDPPEIPNEVTLRHGAKAPVTGVTPTAFETRNLGTTLEVDPVLGADHKIIDLNLAPEIVKLDKVVNWHHQQPDVRFQTQLPIFHTQKITTQVMARSGHYAFLGTTRPLAPTDPKITKNPIVLQFVRPDVSSMGDWTLLNSE